jgi:hypothetical protein
VSDRKWIVLVAVHAEEQLVAHTERWLTEMRLLGDIR